MSKIIVNQMPNFNRKLSIATFAMHRAANRSGPLSAMIRCVLLFALLSLNTSSSQSNCYATATTQVPLAADRIRNEPESVWVEFIQLALDHKPLNLGQGFPDFAAPTYLVESLQNATIQTSQANILNHQYTRSFGHPRLVRALRDYYMLLRNSDLLVDEKSQVLVTVGAYEALFTAIMAFVDPGDEVIIIDPAFDAYAPMVAMAGGKSVFIPLRLDSAAAAAAAANGPYRTKNISSAYYKLDMNELITKINAKTRAIVLNTPNNPMGKIYSRQELAELAKLCEQHNMLVIADEVYEQFYYDSNEHVSIASLPGMWERTITIGSAGKTFSVTGWKIGWAYGPAHLIRYMQLVHQTAVYTVATPLQEALAAALEHEIGQVMMVANNGNTSTSSDKQQLAYWAQLREDLTRKRNRMARVLERAQMRPVVPEGGYFMLADFSNLAKLFPEYTGPAGEGDKTKNNTITTNDYKFARWLSRVKHLQGIPGGAFYSEANKSLGKDLIRLCFIKSDDTLDKFEKLIDELIETSPVGTKQMR